MTDLELTRKCAEAMDIEVVEPGPQSEPPEYWMYHDNEDGWREYDPLHDDAQAMALVKKFRLRLSFNIFGNWWTAKEILANDGSPAQEESDSDLNRAICECVAAMDRGSA